MSFNATILLYVLALSCRTAPALEDRRLGKVARGVGSLLLLLLPLLTVLLVPAWGDGWQSEAHFIGHSLTAILLVTREPDWEKWWAVGLAWTVFPLIGTAGTPGLWLALIMAEFLLFLTYHRLDAASPYHKFALVRLLVVFQFFVVESLFPHLRPPGVARALSFLLLLLYLAALRHVVVRSWARRRVFWPFLLAYLQYGWLLALRLWPLVR